MSRTGGRGNDEAAEQGRTERAGEWFAESTLRIALAVFGFVLLLFSLGQAVGIDLLGMVVDALTTRMGRWLVVAFFALAIIIISVRGFDWGTTEGAEREDERNQGAGRNRKR